MCTAVPLYTEAGTSVLTVPPPWWGPCCSPCRHPPERGRPVQKEPHATREVPSSGTCQGMFRQADKLCWKPSSQPGCQLSSLTRLHVQLRGQGRSCTPHAWLNRPPSGIHGAISLAACPSARSAPGDCAQQAGRPSHPGSPGRASAGAGHWPPSPADHAAQGLVHSLRWSLTHPPDVYRMHRPGV